MFILPSLITLVDLITLPDKSKICKLISSFVASFTFTNNTSFAGLGYISALIVEDVDFIPVVPILYKNILFVESLTTLQKEEEQVSLPFVSVNVKHTVYVPAGKLNIGEEPLAVIEYPVLVLITSH
jgi:hypothetical protein